MDISGRSPRSVKHVFLLAAYHEAIDLYTEVLFLCPPPGLTALCDVLC